MSKNKINKDRQMVKEIKEWKPTKPFRPPDWIQSSDYQSTIFHPSYDVSDQPVDMFYLLSNEYSRRWLQERDFYDKMLIQKKKLDAHRIPEKNLTRPGHIQMRNVHFNIIKNRNDQLTKQQITSKKKKFGKKPKEKPIIIEHILDKSPRPPSLLEKNETLPSKPQSEIEERNNKMPEEFVEKCPCGCLRAEECTGPPHPNYS